MTETEGYNHGTVTGVNSSLIIIDDNRFFLGEQKADDIEVGDIVEWSHNGGSFLTHLKLLKKKNGKPVSAPPQKSAKKDQGPPPQTCVMGECPDKGGHFQFNKQRNRWECNLMGVDNPNISHCPHVPKKVTGSNDLDDKLAKADFGAPSEPQRAVPVKVIGVYLGNNKQMIMLKTDERNTPFVASPELIAYLNSKDSKAKVNDTVTITLEKKKDGSGSWATGIGPGPEDEKRSDPAPEETGLQQDTMHVPAAVVPFDPSKTQVAGPMTFDEAQINLIKSTVAKDCTNTEFKLLMYLASQYHLDPIRKQIWAVKYGDAPASIFTGRDGFLAIAHRSGHLDGMKSGVKEIAYGDKTETIGWCEIWRNDMSRPFYIEVFLSDYQQPIPRSGKPGLWQKMPRVMIQKVAESTCLRRAFSITGLYSPEEMDGDA